MKIVLVHGRDQCGRDPDEVKHEWWSALVRGCDDAGLPVPSIDDVRLPFYGPLLEEGVAEAQTPLADEIAERGPANVDSAYLEFRAALIEELRSGAGITDTQVRSELPPEQQAAPEKHAWIHAILRALDRYMPRMTDGAVDLFARDVWFYLTSSKARDKIDYLVGTAIGPEPSVVVGHSLGAVVAYSMLRRVHVHVIPRLVTLGSPLGLTAIRNHFRPLKFPDGVQDWFNGYDERDLVALHGMGPELFPLEPTVRNDKHLDNHTRNCHGMVGYLENANVARAVCSLPQGHYTQPRTSQVVQKPGS